MLAEFNKLEAAYLATACLKAEAERESAPHTVYVSVVSRDAESNDAAVSLRAVSKAIEEGVLPRRKSKRVVCDAAAIFYLASVRSWPEVHLSRDTKLRLFESLKTLIEHDAGNRWRDWRFELANKLVFDPGASLERWASLVAGYADDRSRYIEIDPDKMGGVPVIRDTRIPVKSVLGRHDDGESLDEIAEDYPDIPEPAFAAAVAYARTHPDRGRPRKRLR